MLALLRVAHRDNEVKIGWLTGPPHGRTMKDTSKLSAQSSMEHAWQICRAAENVVRMERKGGS